MSVNGGIMFAFIICVILVITVLVTFFEIARDKGKATKLRLAIATLLFVITILFILSIYFH